MPYAKGMLYLLPAWLIYIAVVIYLPPKRGLFLPLAIGIVLYTAASCVTSKQG